MLHRTSKYTTLFTLIAFVLIIFIGRTWLAASFNPPRFFDIFIALTVLGSIFVTVMWRQTLHTSDWFIALALGGGIALGMYFASLFSPYPFFGLELGRTGQACVRGLLTFAAALGGLTIMRMGGPVQCWAANRDWKRTARDLLLGSIIGVPLSILNVAALRFTSGQSLVWQNPLSAAFDALQPAVVEEVIFRFAAWGLLWLLLKASLPESAVTISGGLALLIHNYSHFDELFVQSPLTALGMGLVIAVLWGLPPTLLAKKRGLESAIAFHWVQDAARFWAGL